jgi:hypothetical protein
MVKFASHLFQGIAGRSNFEFPDKQEIKNSKARLVPACPALGYVTAIIVPEI